MQCKHSSLDKTNNKATEERASHACPTVYLEENAVGKEVPEKQGHCQPPLSTHLEGACDRDRANQLFSERAFLKGQVLLAKV